MLKTVLVACALLCAFTLPAVAESPNNFLAGVRSIDLTMTRIETASHPNTVLATATTASALRTVRSSTRTR